MLVMKTTLPAGKAGHILVLDGIAPTSLIQQVHKFAVEASDFVGMPGETVHGSDPDKKRTTDIRLNTRRWWTGDWSVAALKKRGVDVDAMDEGLAQVVGDAMRSFVLHYPHAGGCRLNDSGYQVQRYRRGEGFYSEHVDGSPLVEYGRMLAFILYLNTVKRGGETVFPLHEVQVSPVAGRVVVFPASWTHPHKAGVPVSSDKFMVSTFLYPII